MNYPRTMVSIDTRPAEADSTEPSIRPYSTEDFAWAVALLDVTGGRYRVRRGRVVDVAVLPGLIAVDGGRAVALLTLSRHRDELEFSVLATTPGIDGQLSSELLAAGQSYASETCRRVWAICSNAEFEVQRLLQRNGFRLCAVRPGAIEAAALQTPNMLATELGGIPVRDEVEFDLLLP